MSSGFTILAKNRQKKKSYQANLEENLFFHIKSKNINKEFQNLTTGVKHSS